MIAFGKKITEQTISVKDNHEQSRFTPLNLQVQANRLGQDGSSIAIVANQYEAMTSEIQAEMVKFTKASDSVKEMIGKAQFIVCAGSLEQEMVQYFKNEKGNDHIDANNESQILSLLSTQTFNECKITLKAVSDVFKNLKNVNNNLTQLITGLEIVRLTGRTEVAKIQTNKTIFESLIEDLSNFRESLKASLKQVDELTSALSNLSLEISDQCKMSKSP